MNVLYLLRWEPVAVCVGSQSGQLWWLLDIASADEPERSEQRSDVGELEHLESRQLGGVWSGVAFAATGDQWRLVVEGGRKCLRCGSQLLGLEVVVEKVG